MTNGKNMRVRTNVRCLFSDNSHHIMEERRRAYSAFMTIRSPGMAPTDQPIAHLQFFDGKGASHMSGPLIAFTRENVVAEFDIESDLVRWLLNQMSTYEPTRQSIVGLVFDRSTILSDVIVTQLKKTL